MRKFTKQEDKFLWKNYLKIPAKRMALMLDRREGTARQRMKLLGITVPPEITEKFKKESHFPKGHQPFNKGRDIKEWMSKAAVRKSAVNRFKKGRQPHNTLSDGAIVIRNDKGGRKYQWIRISKGNWKMLHVKKWEDKHGSIPKGMIIIFRDKNPMNCTLRNLKMISRKENMKRNTIHNYPKDIARAVQLIGALQRQINKKQKS